jgi:prepilin-type N-terminal cleavage/methylation domain-containing protein/prepilin-type processing-associated H-X9-DG protein
MICGDDKRESTLGSDIVDKGKIKQANKGVIKSILWNVTHILQHNFRQNVSARHMHGFTLLEILIVVAIISILASMLLPALQKAREKARQSVCVNNLKQIGMGVLMYVNDWDGYIPGAGHETVAMAFLEWWDRNDASYAVGFQLGEYVKCFDIWPLPENCIWHCPSDGVNWDPGDLAGDSYGRSSYLYNRRVMVDGVYGTPGIAKKITRFQKPSGSVVISEQLYWYCHVGRPGNTGSTGLDQNAEAGGNYLFLDGHVGYYYGMTPGITNWMQSTDCW